MKPCDVRVDRLPPWLRPLSGQARSATLLRALPDLGSSPILLSSTTKSRTRHTNLVRPPRSRHGRIRRGSKRAARRRSVVILPGIRVTFANKLDSPSQTLPYKPEPRSATRSRRRQTPRQMIATAASHPIINGKKSLSPLQNDPWSAARHNAVPMRTPSATIAIDGRRTTYTYIPVLPDPFFDIKLLPQTTNNAKAITHTPRRTNTIRRITPKP